jgi:hypothetical protein
MAHLPFLLQQSTTSLDDLQATMEEVQPLLWFTAGLFVLTLLLTAVLIFRKQNQKKKKEKKDKREKVEETIISNPNTPKPEEKQTSENKETIIFEEKTAPETQQNTSASTPAEESLVEDKKTMAPIQQSTTPNPHATKEEVTSLVDEALKETKSREENLEAIKKRLEELGVAKKEAPTPTVTLEPNINEVPVEANEDMEEETFEDAEVIYMEAEPMFEPLVTTSAQEEEVEQEETTEKQQEEQPIESVTWSITITSENLSTQESPSGSMLPQQIKTFADWLRDYK